MWRLRVEAKNQVQLNGLFLRTALGKMIVTSLSNRFLARNFSVKLDVLAEKVVAVLILLEFINQQVTPLGVDMSH